MSKGSLFRLHQTSSDTADLHDEKGKQLSLKSFLNFSCGTFKISLNHSLFCVSKGDFYWQIPLLLVLQCNKFFQEVWIGPVIQSAPAGRCTNATWSNKQLPTPTWTRCFLLTGMTTYLCPGLHGTSQGSRSTQNGTAWAVTGEARQKAPAAWDITFPSSRCVWLNPLVWQSAGADCHDSTSPKQPATIVLKGSKQHTQATTRRNDESMPERCRSEWNSSKCIRDCQ